MTPMKTKDILSSVFILSLLSGLIYLWFSPAGVKSAPDYTFKIVDGRSISMTSLRGKPVIISFWATSCPGCIKEMPHLIELYHDYEKQGLEIIGIAMAYDPPNHVMEMRKRKNIPYPISLDIDSSAATAFGEVSLTPTSILISPEGKIVMQKTGALDMAQVRQHIQSMIGKAINASG
jgi:peroxiredoxin